jgi:hypothetical protein
VTALLLEPAAEHVCQCGSTARVWVVLNTDDHEPCCRACAARVASEPSFRESLVAAHSEPADDVLPPFRLPQPELSQFHKAGAATARRIATDPSFRQRFVEHGRRVTAQRRRCLGPACSMVTNAPALARHLRASGHTGYEEVPR